jgi:putative hemolysin
MPPLQSDSAKSAPKVLSRAVQLPGLSVFAEKLLAEKFMPLGKVRSLVERLHQSPEGFRIDTLLGEMRIQVRIDDRDVARIPANGRVVVVANHPFGVLDGAILTRLLTRVRHDVKVMANFLLDDVPELQRHCIFVDPFHSDHSVHANRRPVKEALAWLHSGGLLAMFPSGEVSHWQFSLSQVADPAWNETAARLVRRTGASVLPVFFCGQNSVRFQVMGMLHPRLRTTFLLQEFLQQEGRTVEVRIGSPIDPETISAIADDRQTTEYLRSRTYLLAQRRKHHPAWPSMLRSTISNRIQRPLAQEADSEQVQREIDQFPPEQCLVQSGELCVYAVHGREIAALLHELGRLRELTFRHAGEGTGRALDIDRYDKNYWHFVLWNRKQRQVLGAYRAARTAEIVPQQGIAGLYTSTLFRYDARLFETLGPALELGRSFVRREYQRQYGPLLLLWRGIAHWIGKNPETPVLFGAVSVSNQYSPASREMIYRFFESKMRDEKLANLVEPRQPFRPPRLRSWDCRAVCQVLRDIEHLSEPIADIESDRKGVPVLLRQYAKLGGKLLGFNVDRKFSNVLDGLVAVDLRQTEAALLERYMGRKGKIRFQQYHNLTPHLAAADPEAEQSRRSRAPTIASPCGGAIR